MAEEGVTPNEEVDEEEEEEEQSSDDRQTLDDLTVLTDTTSPLDDGEEQGAGDDTLEWEEPAASQSLSTIHTGSRPTDAELMANLVPEGDTIIEEGEIVPPEEVVGAELPEVDAELPETEPDPEPEPEDEDVEVEDALGDEDTAIPLNIDPGDAAEVLIEGVPDGAVLSAGTDNGDGTWTLTAEELEGLTITPPADSDVDFTLQVTGEGETQDLEVTVNAVADAPTATAEDATGQEDTAIALDLGSALTDIDGSESLSITIDGVPTGAALSAGTDNGDGTWSVSLEDLDGITITPPQDFNGEIPLTLITTSTEADGGDSATTTVPFTVTVTDTIDGEDADGYEDQAISLDIDPAAATSIDLGNIPDGSTLTYVDDQGATQTISFTGNSATLTADQLNGLAITPPADSDVNFTLNVTADGFTDTMDVTVRAVADMPTVSAQDATGGQDAAVPLDLSSALTDLDGSEVLSVTISIDSGVPDGVTFSAGTDNGDGTWTFTADQLDGLTITPPPGFSGDIPLSMEATATELDAEGDGPPSTATNTIDFNVTITEEGQFQTTDAVGDEDTGIPLEIDPGTAATVTIGDVPTGATLSAGTDNGNGTWTLTAAELDGLTITPPADSDVDFTLNVTADGDSQPLDVTVNAVADTPTATAADATGTEDTAIPLDLTSALTDVDGSEVLSVTLSIGDGIPDGTTFSAGTDNGDGTWTFTAGELVGLEVTPPPNFFGEIPFDLTATSTEQDGGDTASTTVPFTVTVESASDIEFEHAAGVEDTAIALTIDGTLIDGNSLNISNIPDGAVLEYVDGTGATQQIAIIDGTADLTLDQLNGLQITPPPDSDVDFSLTLTADGVSEEMHVTVDADADAPTATAEDAVGLEDNPIDLDLSAALTDVDGSESLSFTIQGVPDGAVLSAGTDNGDGTWSLVSGQLTGLTITPPVNFEGEIPMTLVATSTEADGGDFETTEVPFTVTVEPDLTKPDFEATAAEGFEDNAIALDIDPGTVDVVTIGNVPTGAVLSAGTDNGDGTWTVDAGDLAGITITPPQDSDEEFTLTVTGTDISGNTQTLDVPVTVHAVADRPDLDVTSSIGDEDTSIPLTIASNLTDTDGSETLSLSIDIIGIPEGATLTYVDDQGDTQSITITDNSASLTQNQLNDLSITPPQDYYGDITLQVTSTSTEGAEDASPSSAATTATFGVTVRPVNDDPDVTATNVSGDEDTAINLDISAAMSAETTVGVESVLLGGIPSGSTLTYVDDQGATQSISFSGSVANLSPDQLNGLSITPPQDFNGVINMTATAFSEDGGVDVAPFNVDVAAIADLEVVDTATGNEDTAIALDIQAAPDESVTISGVPDGASLSAGTDNGDGTWTLTSEQLDGLTITPPADSDADFTLGIVSGELSDTIDVTVNAVADAADLTTAAASGSEDTAIPLTINTGLADTDGSESLSINIGDIPTGSVLTYVDDQGATQTLTVTDGSVDVTADQLNGLQITPPDDYSGSFDLSVTATTTEAEGGDTAVTTGTLSVDITGVADAPTLDLTTPATGTEDTAIALNINTAVTDASETLSVTVSGVPTGATLSAGTDNGDGTWTLSADDLTGLTVTPPANSDVDFQLSVTATSTDGTDTATTSGTIDVSVAADADTPTLDLTTPATGDEDTAIALNINPGLTDTDGSESLSITIAGVPNGATLSAGTDNLDGTWTLSPDDLNGLTITPDDNFDGTFDLAVTATATEADGGDTAVASGTLTVDVAAVADTPTLTLSDVSGAEDTGIPLSIAVGGDDDIASVVISGVPTGASLSAGTDNGDGTWTLTTDDLAGLTVTPPADSDADFQLSVTATAVDGSDTATASGTIDVAVTGVADTPTLNLTAAAGDEEAAIPLNIQTGLTDTDGSESLSISISGIPDGAVLASGGVPIDITNGTADLTPVQLNNLTITPPADSSQDFQLSVTTTSTEADGDTASTSGTLDVTVNGVADTPTLDLTANVTGTEDTAIPLTINAGVTDADETLSVILNNIPDGATLTYVDDQGATQDISFTGTAATLTPDQLNGLAITPPPDSNDNFQLAVTAISNDEGDTATSSGVLNVGVVGDADAPIVNLFDAQGTEDNAISLNISAGLSDTDGSETLSSVTISGVPQGAVLSAGTDTGSGTWIVSADDLAGLSITPPEDFSGSFDLSVAVTSTENDGDTATTTGTMTVDVSGVADAPTLVLDSAAGIEDKAIALDINAGLTDDSESLAISISGIPDGAVLNYVDDQGATQSITVSNGGATLTSEQLNGLTVTPPADSNEDFSLTVTASSTDGSDTATTTGTIDVTVFGDADMPTLDLSTPISGEQGTTIPLTIDAGLTDTDGSETLSITIGNIPDGAVLASGGVPITITDGSAELTQVQLNNLTITPPPGSADDMALLVTATSTEDDGDTAQKSGILQIDVQDGTAPPTLTLTDSAGVEDNAIGLNIGATDVSSIVISNVPNGATLSAGIDNGNGTWTLTQADLGGLTITPPADSDVDMTLTVTATGTDGTTTSGTLDVDVAADADTPTLDLTDAAGQEDSAIALNIDPGLTDTDGSESLSITITGVPNGATLSAGTDNQDGTWTLTEQQLDGLEITPPADFNGSFDLGVTATATEADGGDTATTSGTLSVDVSAVGDGVNLTLSDAAGVEDNAIPLTITADTTDGSETLSVSIADIPAGATLSYVDGNGDTQSITVTNGTADLTPDQLNGLAITPPADSDVDFALDVTATSTDGTDTATTNGSLSVSVAADADTPTLDLSDAAGTEDNAIALTINPGLTDTDGSEGLSVSIGDIPAGSTLTYVDDQGATQTITVTNGSADLTADQLNGLQITPPDDFSGSFDLAVTATATEADGGDTATTSGTLTVDVAAVADEADLTVSDASGLEDTAIALDIDAGVTDAGESLSITISGVPDGATLSAGTENPDGTWTLTEQQLDGLTVTPPADSNENFQLTVSATTTDGTDTETVTSTLDVSVTGDADAPAATVQDETGTEDTWIQLNLDSALSDTDGSESLTITITDVPDGALLAPGTDNGDGTWSVTPAELPQVCILPPDDFSGEITMSLNVTATENDGDTETTSQSFKVTVEGDADAPTVTVSDASGTEDTAIPLTIDAGVTDASETLSISIGDIPDGATLTYVDGNNETQTITVENGSADLTADQLNGLSITPPADSNEDFQLSVSATSTDGTDTATTTSTLDVAVTGDADAPTLEASIDDGTFSSGGTPESDPVTVDIANDGALTFSGASSYGDIAYSTGEIEISADDSGTFNLQSLELGRWGGDGIVVKAYDENGNEITSQSISMGSSYGVGGTVDFSDVSGFDGVHSIGISNPGGYIKVGDVTTTTGDADGGDAVTTYDLDVNTALTDTDGSETLSVTISDVPDGVTLSAGTDNGDGTWSVDPADLDGLEMTVPEGTEDFSVTVSATATENDGDTETTTQTIDVGSLDTVAETPTVTVQDAAGLEDADIAITINAALGDTDGSETLSVTIGDVPDGATLSAGTDNGDGTWTIDPADLDGLSITPPADSDADFTLSVSVTATETLSGDTSTVTAELDVSVEAVADAPTLDTADASGTEDNAIALNITSGLTDTDGSESLSITISGVPDGATLCAGTENQDGTWTLSADQLNGLSITPPADSDADFTLSVAATTTDGADTKTVTASLPVSVAADADTPTLNLADASGSEDNAIALNIDPGLGDTDGSESLSITISGVPDGATLSAGTDNQDGTWTLDADDLNGLTITPPDDYSGSFDLSVTATATEADGGDTATTSGTITVDVAGVADAADLSVSDASGTEDQAIALNIDAGVTDSSESLSITISGVPDGATLSAGTENQDGTWTLTEQQLDGLTVTPAADSDADFTLTVNATTTDGTDTETVSGTIDVSVAADADAPTLNLADASGTEDNAIALNISAGLTDTDGSESLSITISGVPDGATLSAGTENQDGTWTLEAGDLQGLTVTPPADSDADFTLSVTATSTDGSDTATTSGTIDVSVAADADTPSLNLSDASGTEDNAIALNIDPGLGDADGSESLSVTISGVPDGATLSAGTENQDGTWTLDANDLNGLTITPPDDYSGSFDLSVTAPATEADGGDTATTSGTITVDVAGVADEADLTVSDASGTEDQAIALNIDADVTDSSESLSITISGVPDGATLSAGTENQDGTWTLTEQQLDNLTITPADDYSGSFDLTVTATATEADGGDTATTSGTITVDVADVAEEVTLTLDDSTGVEDNAIALNIDTSGDAASITISGVPDGATLSAGTENQDGTWTLTDAQLDNLTVTPPADSDADFTLTVTATSADGTETTGTVDVTVTGDADAPTLSADATYSDTEAVATTIDVPQSITDAATGDNTVTASNVPNGATLSAGSDNGDGAWTLAAGDVDGLTVTPADGSTDTMSLSFEVSGTGGSGDSLASENFDSGVSGWSGGATSSGGQMKLQGDTSTSKTFDFGSEHGGQTVTISFDFDAGSGWEESGQYTDYFNVSANGSEVLDTTEADSSSHSFTVTLDENGQVTLEMSTNTTASSEYMMVDNLEITAGDDWSTTLASETVDVTPDPENLVYDLDITSALTDTDGSETLSITVDDLPDGAVLSAGTENQDGSWTLEAGDLNGLTISVPDGSGDFNLAVSATATEADGDTNTVSATVSVEAPDLEADGVNLDTTDASGSEDTAIALDIDATLADTDGSETVSITISGVPEGATLSAGTENPDGTWTLEAGDLSGLTVTPATDSSTDFTLTVSATTTEASTGDTSTSTSTVDVSVAGVADAPTLSVELGAVTATGGEDSGGPVGSITVANSSFETDSFGDGGYSSGSVSGWSVSGSGGAWDPGSSEFNDQGSSDGTHGVPEGENVGWAGWGGSLSQTVDGTFEADRSYELSVNVGDAGSSSSPAYEIRLYAGDELVGSVDQSDFPLTDQEFSTATISVNGSVFADNFAGFGGDMRIELVHSGGDSYVTFDQVELSAADIGSDDGYTRELDITSSLTDTDGSETLSITVSDVPDGVTLSAGTENPDGTWTLSSGDLDGLTMTVPADTADFDLSVSATATEADGDTNTVTSTVSVTEPDLESDGVSLSTSDASGSEDRAVALDIGATLTDTDGSETMSITISGVPDGATLSAGTENQDGTWTLDSGDLSGLTILPAEDSATDFSLTVTATATETTTGDTSTTTSTVNVTVDGVADAPELAVTLGSGTETGGGVTPAGYWNVDETSGSTFYDSIGDNDGAMHGNFDKDDSGVFGTTSAEFRPGSSNEYIEVDHSDALKPDNGAITMWFNADDVTGRNALASSDSSGNDDGGHFSLFVENGQIRLRMQGDNSEGETNLYGGSVSTGDWNQVTVTWGDDGARIYLNGEQVAVDENWTRGLEGNENPWTFGANQWSSSDNVANNLRDYFDGHMDDIAIYDQQLTADQIAGLYDDGVTDMMNAGDPSIEYPLTITTALADTDGSESLSITVDGLPDGAVLSAGTENQDGTWTLESGDLSGLTVTVPSGADDFMLNVSATATDEGGDTRTASQLVQADVGDDGFDAGTTGTDGADTLTGSSGDDVISGEGGADDIDAGDGDDMVMGGAGDDIIDGGDGADIIDAGAGADTIEGGAGDDHVMGGAGDDLFIFGSGDGADYFNGGDGWSDTVQLEGVDSGPGGDSGWTLQVDEGTTYTETESGVEFDAEASGSIVLADGSELTFDNVEKLEW